MEFVHVGLIIGGLIIAAIIIIVIVINTRGSTETTVASASTTVQAPGSTPGTAPATEPVGYVSMPPAAVWDPSPGGKVCASGFDTLVGGYCVLPEEKAQAACDADPECTGYLRPTNDLYPVRGLPQGSVQLAHADPVVNAGWPGTIFHKKPKN